MSNLLQNTLKNLFRINRSTSSLDVATTTFDAIQLVEEQQKRITELEKEKQCVVEQHDMWRQQWHEQGGFIVNRQYYDMWRQQWHELNTSLPNATVELNKRITELESQNQGISVEDKLPATYGLYDSYGNDLTVSDPVVTNKGLACYCSEHDIYGRSVWIGVDWDHKEAGGKLEGVTSYLPLPVTLSNQAKAPKEQGE